MLDLEFVELTNCGLTRKHNEDFLGHVLPSSTAQVRSQGWLFALADGVGGHADGEIASRLAIETMLAGFQKMPKGVVHTSVLPRLVQDANTAVYDAGHARSANRNTMSTTMVACALRFDSAVIAHVGDSRCYLFRNGTGAPLTRDHTMAAEQFRMGLLSRTEAGEADNRHILTRSLGSELFVAADTITVNITPGDIVMLCSDGLHGYVQDTDIIQIIHSHRDLSQAAEALVVAANQSGGHDNISVQLIRVRTVERMGLYRGRPYRLL